MEIRELRSFVAIGEEGGLSAAARRLHVSQSALSQTVQSLERQLGVQLLSRDHAGARPTNAGNLLLGEARSLIEQHDRAVALVTGQVPATHVLRIGVPLELPPDVLPTALGKLSVSYPQTEAAVRHSPSAAQLTALRKGELDLAFVRDRPTDPSLDAVLAVEEAMGVIVADATAPGIGGPGGARLDELAGLTWLGFPRSASPAWYDQVASTMRVHGVRGGDLADTALSMTAEVKLGLVASGRIFALAPRDWAGSLPDGISWHALIGDPIVRRTWAVWIADPRRPDLAALVGALDITAGG